MNYGADKTDWVFFSEILGLTEDLLPVVCNPVAEISAKSALKALGKVPSRYYSDGTAGGIKDWTSKRATLEDIERWSQEPDYGICVQTRVVRALDIDVPEPTRAAMIADTFLEALGTGLPRRWRNNSGKCLYAFRLPGELGKRSFKTEGGIVEFLATGQQFVAIGTHSSGARIEWDELDLGIPNVTLEAFEFAWNVIHEAFALDKETRGSDVARRKGPTVVKDDPIADWLIAQGLVLDSAADRLYIDCPWKDKHSSDSGVTQTAYFLAGTNGYELGHFKCMHASCQHEYEGGDHAVLSALGHPEHVFEDLGPPAAPENPKRVRKGQLESTKNGICATLNNLLLVLSDPEACGAVLKRDEFLADDVICWDGESEFSPVTDVDYVALRARLEENGFEPIGRELMRDAVLMHCEENRMDSGKEWVSGLKWDGVKRCETFLIDYFGVEANAYIKAVGHYFWSAAAGRLLEPGCQADMMMVLQGMQGAGKTSAVGVMAPREELFASVSFNMKDDDLKRLMTGKCLVEVAELQGLNSRDAESIKAFITTRYEEWVPKYREKRTRYLRRALLVGTSNSKEFLADPTGARRFLPVWVDGMVDLVGLKKVRNQLWAEGAELFKKNGVMWGDAYGLAGDAHKEATIYGATEEELDRWLSTPGVDGKLPGVESGFTSSDVYLYALNFSNPASVPRVIQKEVSELLRKKNFERKSKRAGHRFEKVWVYASCTL